MGNTRRSLRFAVSGTLLVGSSFSCTSRVETEKEPKPESTSEPAELRHTVKEGPQPPTTAIVEEDPPPLPNEETPEEVPVKESPAKAPEKDPEPKHVNFGPAEKKPAAK